MMTERQFFHSDASDIVGLLCITRALEGGESDIVSSHSVYNTLAAERPDALRTLIEPIWYFDRKGETSSGQDEYIRTSVLYLERGPNPRVYTKYVTHPPSTLIEDNKKKMGPLLRPLARPLQRKRPHPAALPRTTRSPLRPRRYLPPPSTPHGPRGRRHPVRCE